MLERVETAEKKQLAVIESGFESLSTKLNQANKMRLEVLSAVRSAKRPSDGTSSQQVQGEVQLNQLDTVVSLLETHQRHTQDTLLRSAVVLAVVAPVLAYLCNLLK